MSNSHNSQNSDGSHNSHLSSSKPSQSRPDVERDGSDDSATEPASLRPSVLHINGTEPHDQHAKFPVWAGDWSKNNVVDRRGGTTCRREGERVRRGTPRDSSVDATEVDLVNTETEATGDLSGLASASRRRGAGRRLSDFGRSAEEGDFNGEQFMFVMAIDAFKRANGMTFPAWTDVLEIVRLLGYRKTCRSELELRSAEDWTEKPDAKSKVRPEGWEKRAA